MKDVELMPSRPHWTQYLDLQDVVVLPILAEKHPTVAKLVKLLNRCDPPQVDDGAIRVELAEPAPLNL